MFFFWKGQQQQAEQAKARKAEKEKEWNKREKELVAQGKKPFFLKKCKMSEQCFSLNVNYGTLLPKRDHIDWS